MSSLFVFISQTRRKENSNDCEEQANTLDGGIDNTRCAGPCEESVNLEGKTQRTNMTSPGKPVYKIRCVCQLYLGEKEPLEDSLLTHIYCKDYLDAAYVKVRLNRMPCLYGIFGAL